MRQPSADAFFAAIDATWPARRVIDLPGWKLREGGGGGSRVSSATATNAAADLAVMEVAQSKIGQTPLVMVRDGGGPMDERLAAEGYEIIDPVTCYVGPVDALADPPPPVTVFSVDWPPSAIQTEIWAEGGIGAARLAVMDRAEGVKTALLGRTSDQPAAVAFAACHGPLVMVHALEVTPRLRRQGLGRHMMQGAATWASDQGASWLGVLVTQANAAANSLYASLGMEPVGGYHYRIKRPEPLEGDSHG